MRRMIKKILFIGFAILGLNSCYYDKADKLYPAGSNASCDTANTKYSVHVAPIIKTNCVDAGCHKTINPSGGLNFETHAGLTASIAGDKLKNALNYTAGGTKNMPPAGKLSNCDIVRIETWIANGAKND